MRHEIASHAIVGIVKQDSHCAVAPRNSAAQFGSRLKTRQANGDCPTGTLRGARGSGKTCIAEVQILHRFAEDGAPTGAWVTSVDHVCVARSFMCWDFIVILLAPSCTFMYKVLMRMPKRTIATAELLLVFPAVLFMTALFVRNLQPQQYEPAQTAQQIVTWYAARPRLGLWVFLITSPLAVLAIGFGTLLRGWSNDVELRQAALRTLADVRTHLAMLLVAGSTLAAGGILAIVALHLLTD